MVGPHQQSHVSSDFDVLVRLDRNGRRVPAKTASPLDLQGTIVFVGDSTTFGWGVEAAAAFPEIVGAALRHRVVNLGVPGYGVDQSVTLLERQGLAENPSWVVLMLAGNDLIETSAGVSYGRTKIQSRLVAGALEVSAAGSRAVGWLEYSALWTALRARWRFGERPASREQQLALVGAWVDRARGACQASHSNLLVVDWDVISDEYAESWTAQGLAVVRVGPLLRDLQAAGVRPIFAHDPHWVGKTHEVVAREIVNVLRRPPP